MSDTQQAAIEIEQLTFSWRGTTQPLLKIEQLELAYGERLFLSGPSGSGKSTLLNLLGGMLIAQHGAMRLLGHNIQTMNNAQRDQFRADHLGFIFQQFNLIPYLSALDNVCLAAQFSPKRRKKLKHRTTQEAIRLLEGLGLTPNHYQTQPARALSIGQQQRVAAARALLGSPEILIADEPTSSLDRDHQALFLQQLFEQCTQQNTTLLFVSHDDRLATHFDRSLSLAEINQASEAGPC